MTTTLPPSRRRWLTAGVGVAALAAGGGWALWRSRRPAEAVPGLWAQRFDRPSGGELALQALRGRPLLINFWATWCAPCVQELPQIDRFYREFAPRGWQVVGLAIDRAQAVQGFLGRVPVSFPVGLAGLAGSQLMRDFGNGGGALPFTVLLDADGRLLRKKLGETSYDELKGWAGET